MRKPAVCICENKDADQLRGNREADQGLCFRYTDSTITLLPKSEISGLWPSSMALQPGLCETRSDTPKTGFLTTRLIYKESAVTSTLAITIRRLCNILRFSKTVKMVIFRQFFLNFLAQNIGHGYMLEPPH